MTVRDYPKKREHAVMDIAIRESVPVSSRYLLPALNKAYDAGYTAGRAAKAQPVCDWCGEPVVARRDPSVNSGRPAWCHTETGWYSCGPVQYGWGPVHTSGVQIAEVNGNPDPPEIAENWETASADLIDILGDDHDEEECDNLADLIEEVRKVVKSLRQKVADAAAILNG